jgi:transcriptional regulator with GAF, ATPase, and Fis domain
VNPDDLLRELGELATSLGPAVRPAGTEELLRSLTETARQLFGAAACSLALLSPDESELVYTVAAGQGAADVTGMRIPAAQGIAGWVVQSGQPIAITDVGSDPRFARDAAEQTGYVPRAILAVPVETRARVLGVITLLDRDPQRPGAERDMTPDPEGRGRRGRHPGPPHPLRPTAKAPETAQGGGESRPLRHARPGGHNPSPSLAVQRWQAR